MAAEASGILDTGNTSGIPNFDGTDANWGSWRVQFEAYAHLAGLGAHLDIAAEQAAFIKDGGRKSFLPRGARFSRVTSGCFFLVVRQGLYKSSDRLVGCQLENVD